MTKTTMFIKPVGGLTIPHPDNPRRSIPEEGASVPNNRLYRRFVAAGEAAEAEAPVLVPETDGGATDDAGADAKRSTRKAAAADKSTKE